MFVILVCGSQLSHGVKLDCEFKNLNFGVVGILYSCFVTSFDNPHNNLNIEGYSGKHKANKNDTDVKGIRIFNTNTKYIPTNLGSLFNLTALRMVRTQLVEIKAEDFQGMQDLEDISFWNNKLSSVPLDAFTTLTKLRYIYLNANQIEELPNGIFKNNLELEEIHLLNNRIICLGTELFNDLENLYYVDLEGNICVNKRYNGATEINQLKEDIKMKCMNPNEIPATTTTTTTTTPRTTTTSTTQTPTTTSTTQNPMADKFIEMQEQNAKLEKELREAKEQQQTNEDALKKELRESMEIHQANEDDLKKNIYGLNQNLFDKKREFHLFKTTCVQIRNKLKKAKENLSNCPNVNPRDLM